MGILTSPTCEEWLALGTLVPVSDETNRLCSDFVHRRLPFAGGTSIDWSAFQTVHRTDIGAYALAWAQSLPIAEREHLVFWFPAAGRGFSAPTAAALTASPIFSTGRRFTTSASPHPRARTASPWSSISSW